MTTEQVSTDDDLKPWAIQLLELTESAQTAGSTSALRLINDQEILPTEKIEAVRIVAGATEIPDWVARSARLHRMTNQVTQFANDYFDIPPGIRRDRWASLHHDCSDLPALRRWLNGMEPGLKTPNRPVSENFQEQELITECCQIFLARGSRQPRQRQQVIAMCQADQSTWNPTIKALKSKHPHFVEAIAPWLKPLPLKEIGPKVWQTTQPPKLSPVDRLFNFEIDFTKSWTWIAIVLVVTNVVRIANTKPNSSPPVRREAPYNLHSTPANPNPRSGMLATGGTDPLAPPSTQKTREWSFEFFQKLKGTSPENFQRLCQEVPGLEKLVKPSKTWTRLDLFVVTKSNELEQLIRNRYTIPPPNSDAVIHPSSLASTIPPWLQLLKMIVAEQLAQMPADEGPVSAIAPENDVEQK